MMLVRRASALCGHQMGSYPRALCTKTAITEQSEKESVDFKILQESVKETVAKNPDIKAAMDQSKADEVSVKAAAATEKNVTVNDGAVKAMGADAGAVGTAAGGNPFLRLGKVTHLSELDKLQLSKDNMIVDTYSLIRVFIDKGFTLEQAETITYTYVQLTNDALKAQRAQCADKAALELMREQTMTQIQALRKDMTILEKSELAAVRNDNEKLKLEFALHQSTITEALTKVKNNLTLDINCERSQAKDDNTQVEKSIANLTTKMTAELGNLQTTFERYKNDIYKTIAGTTFTIAITAVGILYRYYR
ncbi:coiled-coil domain-containing protein 90B, mitochondrial-like [Watersipora subatra]|uniref:coiled-coil domain-containing protein 90B, mitochondrial-like n=1 Tax=Watersipora subatra TaxID=2589382 RepID=UPI00355B5A0D